MPPSPVQVQQQVYRARAAAARKSVLIALRELSRAFNQIRGMADGPTPELDSDEVIAEGAVIAAGPDLAAVRSRARQEEVAARQRMALKLMTSVGVAVVATHMVRSHRKKTRERNDPRDDRRDPVDERSGGRPPARRPLDAPAEHERRRRHVPPPRGLD